MSHLYIHIIVAFRTKLYCTLVAFILSALHFVTNSKHNNAYGVFSISAAALTCSKEFKIKLTFSAFFEFIQ
jgi:hypothetical protein